MLVSAEFSHVYIFAHMMSILFVVSQKNKHGNCMASRLREVILPLWSTVSSSGTAPQHKKDVNLLEWVQEKAMKDG